VTSPVVRLIFAQPGGGGEGAQPRTGHLLMTGLGTTVPPPIFLALPAGLDGWLWCPVSLTDPPLHRGIG